MLADASDLIMIKYIVCQMLPCLKLRKNRVEFCNIKDLKLFYSHKIIQSDLIKRLLVLLVLDVKESL